ncbi:MAG: NYN domain-containing protein [Thermodesulfobacteriota bacterium]
MHLIIDGYNLLHAHRSLFRLNSIELQWEREKLIRQLATYRYYRSCEVTVVFDGWQGGSSTEKRERQRGIEVIFSKIGEKADEVIKGFIKEMGSGVLVISSDREIAKFASRFSVAVISSEEFQKKLREVELKEEGGIKEDNEEERNWEKKGPSRRLSKKEKRLRAALKKL